MLKKLKKLDIFGERVELRFQNSKLYKTYCGMALTILVSLITLTFFIYIGISITNFINLGQDLIWKRSPTILITETVRA